MAAIVEIRGMMGAREFAGNLHLTYDIKAWFGNAGAKGHLIITNLTTGATKTVAVALVELGGTVYDWSVDDPTAAVGNLLKLEFFGSGQIHWTTGPGSYDPFCSTNGSGTASVSGMEIT